MYTSGDLKEMQSWSLDHKIDSALARIMEWYSRWDNHCYISFSGGKDSTVLADLAAQVCKIRDCKLILWFSDTGLEYPEVREHALNFGDWLREKYDIEVGTDFYGSNPMWYKGRDNKNGESKLAGKAAFNSDFNFNLYEYFHFCSKMMKKEDKKSPARGRSSDSPCMIVFCSFEQIQTLIAAAKKHGFIHYIPLVFIKNYSPQVLKANMRVVGATEYAILFYRDKLPKFRNGSQVDENGKTIRGTGHMVFNWFTWERDGKDVPKIHPTQKPVKLLKKLIETFTDSGDVVIDPCCGSGTTLRAARELGRSSYGFEIGRTFYERAKSEMLQLGEE